MKRVLLAVGLLLVAFFGYLTFRALSLKGSTTKSPAAPQIALDEVGAAERLGAAIRLATVSYPEIEKRDTKAWLDLHRHLELSFPKAHKALSREVINGQSLLFTWKGTDASLKPIAFLAHQDVVPIAPGTEKRWTEPPFAGKIAGGFVWGRGALDDKASVLSQLEAIERLVGEKYEPKRTLYFAFGHDEEVGGEKGAKEIAAVLKARGVTLEAVLDEGGFIARGSVPGVTRPVALVGVAEKGYVSIELVAKAEGGHSSMPPSKTAIGQLAEAVSRLEKNQLPATLQSPTREMLLTLGPEMGFSKRLALANLWLFEPLLLRMMAKSPVSNASIRTTTAPTIFQAGIKDNVLPASARAIVNFRLLPGETSASLLEHVRKAIANPEIELVSIPHGEASPVSDTSATPYRTLRSVIESHFPEAVVAPFLTIGGTDTKHYTELTKNIYRFLPLALSTEDVPRIHGVNERVSVADYVEAIRFYRDAIRRFSE
jgi:carboxypeptidase PM20D1